MRDPIEDLKREIREAGGVWTGGPRNAQTYRFPDDRVFVFYRKSGDAKTDARVAARDFQRFCATEVVAAAPIKAAAASIPVPEPVVLDMPAPEPQVVTVPVVTNVVRDRWQDALRQAEERLVRMQDEVRISEHRVAMLRAMAPYLEDPMFEGIVRAVLPQKAPVAVLATKPHEAERVHVTREIVVDAVKMFDRTYTVNEVVDLILAGHAVDAPERKRIRMSTAGLMIKLRDQGVITCEAQGVGKRESVWKTAQKASGELAHAAH